MICSWALPNRRKGIRRRLDITPPLSIGPGQGRVPTQLQHNWRAGGSSPAKATSSCYTVRLKGSSHLGTDGAGTRTLSTQQPPNGELMTTTIGNVQPTAKISDHNRHAAAASRQLSCLETQLARKVNQLERLRARFNQECIEQARGEGPNPQKHKPAMEALENMIHRLQILIAEKRRMSHHAGSAKREKGQS